ncbi:MAG TPA: fumarate reductase subunit C [Burkholderiales bacterium]|jgi:fumarate reductase subunit C|nr:fumarate reductase subunit C [Burkholderiales bacterium]
MATVKTYVRPMQGWWRRNPYFVRYMIREGSSVFLATYAIILLVGLLRLTQGEAAWDSWRAALTSPWSILFHWLALLTVSYHAWTWWKVAPKTAPDLRVGGRPLPEMLITAGGVLATLATSVLVYVIVRWM